MILPSTVRSGRTPNSCWAPPGATRKPVITSSKNEQTPRLVGQLPQTLEEVLNGRNDTHIRGHRLDDDGGHFPLVGVEKSNHRLKVVVLRDQGLRSHRGWGPRRCPGLNKWRRLNQPRPVGRRRGRGSRRRI